MVTHTHHLTPTWDGLAWVSGSAASGSGLGTVRVVWDYGRAHVTLCLQ